MVDPTFLAPAHLLHMRKDDRRVRGACEVGFGRLEVRTSLKDRATTWLMRCSWTSIRPNFAPIAASTADPDASSHETARATDSPGLRRAAGPFLAAKANTAAAPARGGGGLHYCDDLALVRSSARSPCRVHHESVDCLVTPRLAGASAIQRW